jgi:hypothetical protein
VSAVRRVDLAAERVETLVGAGLFDFGDIDGPFPKARFQHCLGVAVHGGDVLVADTYNHKIKRLDLSRGEVRTLIGDGKPGTDREGRLALFEPGGLHAADDALYIADTNNHRIVRVSLHDLSWREVRIEGLAPPRPAAAPEDTAVRAVGATLRAGAETAWTVAVRLPDGAHVSEEAPSSVRVARGEEVVLQRTLLGATWPLAFTLPAQPKGAADLHVQVSFAYCHEGQGVCVPANPAWVVPVMFDPDGRDSTELSATVA